MKKQIQKIIVHFPHMLLTESLYVNIPSDSGD